MRLAVLQRFAWTLLVVSLLSATAATQIGREVGHAFDAVSSSFSHAVTGGAR